MIGSRKKNEIEQSILSQIKDIVKEDEELQEKVRNQMAEFQTLDDSERCEAVKQIMTIISGWGCVALSYGPMAAMQALFASLVPIKRFFTGIRMSRNRHVSQLSDL